MTMTSGRMYPPFGRMTPPAAALWRPPGAMMGGVSYRQLRSLRSFAGGYDCIALQANDAACGGFVAPSGRHDGWGVSYRQLRSLRSLASGYGYVALRANDAAYGEKGLSNGEKGLSKAAIKVIKLLEHECGLREIAIFIQHSNLTELRNGIMASLIEAGFVELTQPDSPRSPTQKYRLT